jgi:hypothetical protein
MPVKNDHNREAIAALKKSLQLRPDERTRSCWKGGRESGTEADFHQRENGHFTLRYEGRRRRNNRTQLLETWKPITTTWC